VVGENPPSVVLVKSTCETPLVTSFTSKGAKIQNLNLEEVTGLGCAYSKRVG
jgi:hypothetical protein